MIGTDLPKPGSSVPPSLLGPKREFKESKVKDIKLKYEGVSSNAPTSDSSSSGDSGSEGEGESPVRLASLGKFQKSPKIKKQAERRQVRMLEMPENGRILERNRAARHDDARRTALRLKPDISRLHRILLSWDYDHGGPEPPVSGDRPVLTRVPDQFHDHKQYLDVFEPLLLLECWAQIIRSKEDVQPSYVCKIISRQFTNDWLDLDVSISENLKGERFLADTDVVLFRHTDGKKCILGKTLSYKVTPLIAQATIRCFLPGGMGDPGLQINTMWHLSKVFRSVIKHLCMLLVTRPVFQLEHASSRICCLDGSTLL